MGNPVCQDVTRIEVSQSFISKLYNSISRGIPFVEPVSTLRINESELVRGVLQMLQGFSSSFLYWDDKRQVFCVRSGIYASHLSQTSLRCILNQFVFSATCLKLVELFVKKVESSHIGAPTLKAFANSVSLWLKRMRNIALNEEVKLAGSDSGMTATLLGLTNSLSSLCSGAEHLLQVLHGAIPGAYFDTELSFPAADMAVHILDYLYKKLNEVSLVQGGEEEAYHMLLVIFIGSLLPYLEGLDSWLYDGTLDDPYQEIYFYANNAVAIDQPAFWEKSYLLRPQGYRKSTSDSLPVRSEGDSTMQFKGEIGGKEHILGGKDGNDMDVVVCPMFLKDIGRAVVSAGKSLQLVRYVQNECDSIFVRSGDCETHNFGVRESFSTCSLLTAHRDQAGVEPEYMCSLDSETGKARHDCSGDESVAHLQQVYHTEGMGVLTLSEVFLVSLVGLVGDGNHIFEDFTKLYPCFFQKPKIFKGYSDKPKRENENGENVPLTSRSEKFWFKFIVDAVVTKNRKVDIEREIGADCPVKDTGCSVEMKEVNDALKLCSQKCRINNIDFMDGATLLQSFCPENPVITVCKEFLNKNSASWDELNISRNFHLPPLNDENLREAIFGEYFPNASMSGDQVTKGTLPRQYGTDYTLGFKFSEFEHLRLVEDSNTLETLYPFPTILPCILEDLPMSELLPFQNNSTLASRVLNWIQSIKPKATPLPVVIIQECLLVYIRKQVDRVGKHILLKLMSDWRLMDELGVLRAIYLLGSGDLLQQFLIVSFDKLDKGDSWDDDFELNTILQESIRNSADGTLLCAPDSLVVSITKHNVYDDEEHATGPVSTPHKVCNQCIGIDALDLLKFTYKVSWPLDLIANMEAIEKYNQVMGFLLKVKRAKFVLDKARRWMWKRRGSMTRNHKHHLLVEQKLLHFVDAFHQYVMDRVFHSAWLELCSGMASAGSLDEVIEVHEAYLLSIQRQCFVAPDKLWALIASRIKTILGLALDFYSVQRTLSSGGAGPAIKARCEMEVDRIEKQFDDCIAFLLRILSFKLNVGHFPHLADLVTRINYNYFYMSDNGNLLTIPSFETTTSKLGKTFPGRPN